ncbi:MAG TPA: hypothetical protein EYP36_13100, partial [Calditrichaeota bacterium]|nr:hypothetical protein [Calditrichota bacterium]
MKIRFDRWVSEEKDVYKKGKIDKIFNWLKDKGWVYKKEGAWWLRTRRFGDHRDWVVMRESGEPTYFLSDIAYHKDKIGRGIGAKGNAGVVQVIKTTPYSIGYVQLAYALANNL